MAFTTVGILYEFHNLYSDTEVAEDLFLQSILSSAFGLLRNSVIC